MDDELAALDEQIETIALGPQSATVDGRSTTERSVSELLEYRRFKAGQQVAANPAQSVRVAQVRTSYEF